MDWPALTDEQAAKLKAEHSDLHATEIKLPRQAGGGTATIVWREPTYDDWDVAAAADDDEDPALGRKAWADALIVWPTDPAAIQRFVELPFAFNNEWMRPEIMPFFGSGATSSSRLL